MQNYVVWQDSRLDLQVETDEDDAVSVTIALKEGENTHEFTQPFVDNIADFQSEEGIPSLEVGVYDYMLYVNYATGLPVAFPDPNDCDGDCDLPTITICEAIEVS